jgi:hypothetical protein
MILSLSQSSPVLVRGVFWGGLFVLFYLLSIRRVYRFKPKYEAER